MTTRLYHMGMLLCAATLVFFTSSCAEESSDTLLETDIEEELVTEEITPPSTPDWVDGVITITIGGRFETKEEMIRALEREFSVGRYTKNDILNEEFTPTSFEKRYTVDIAVVTMLEAGITEPATMQETKDIYWDQGYGPLTLEEVIELRLQLKDQPHSGTGHRMNRFGTLPVTSNHITPCAYFISNRKIDGEEDKYISMGPLLESDNLLDPHEVHLHRFLTEWRWVNIEVSLQELPSRFAATVRGSVVRLGK